jgi:hypothetical protein
MTADGYQLENWQWFDILTEPSPSRTDSTGQPKRIGETLWSLPVEVLTASGHGPREARRVIGALGNEPIDPTIRRLTELRRHCLSCAENAAEVRRCVIMHQNDLTPENSKSNHDKRHAGGYERCYVG